MKHGEKPDESPQLVYLSFFCVLGLAAFFFLLNLGGTPFIDYDEATFAGVAREMVQSHNYTTLTLLGTPWLFKPPLYFWLAAFSAQLFGVSEFAFRLPAALFGVGAVMLVWAIAYQLSKSARTAGVTACILLSSAPFLEAGRQIRLDVPVVFLILLGLYCFLRGREKPVWFTGIGIGAGLGFLDKNVIGFLIAPILFVVSAVVGSWRWLRDKFLWLGILFAVFIVVPWHLSMTRLFGRAFWDFYFFGQVFARYTGKIIGGDIGVGTYLYHLFRFDEPWIAVFGAVSVFFLWRVIREPKKSFREYQWPLAFAFSALFLFVFFAIAQTKLFYYLTPLYPFIALSLGLFWHRLLVCVLGIDRVILFGVTVVLFCVALISMISVGLQVGDPYGVRSIAVEEQKIGMEVQGFPRSIPLYARGHLFWETIQYYSSAREVKLFDDTIRGSFLLILPTYEMDWAVRKFGPRIVSVYQGAGLSLLSVSEK